MGRIRNAVLDWTNDGPRVALAYFLAPETRAQSPRTVSTMQYGIEQFTNWNTKKAVLEGYESHWLVYRLFTMRADAQVSIPIVAKDLSTKDVAADTHPAMKMLANPNPKISMDELKFRVELFQCLAGDAYWFINQVGALVRLDPLRPDRMSIKAYRDKLVYIYTLPNETPVLYDEDEIVHFKNYSPSSDLFGQPVLRANAKLVDTGNAITDFQYHAMKNGLWPSGVLTTGTLTDQQYKRVQDQLKAHKEGPANARRIMVIEDSKGWTPATPTPTDMDFMGGTNLTNQELCTGFGVWAESTGLVPAKYENMRASEVATWNTTHLPQNKKFVATLNMQLAPHFEGIYFDADLSGTPPMVDKRKANAEEGKKYFDMGISTKAINERLGLGFDESDCPDEGMFPVTLLPVGTTRATGPVRAIGSRETRNIALDMHYRATDRRRQGWERNVASKVSSLFKVESSVVAKAVENGAIDTDPSIDSQRGKWITMLTAVYRQIFVDFGEATFDELTPRTKSFDNVEDMITDLHESRDFDPWSKEIEKYVNAHVAEEIDYISDATKKKIRAIVLEGEKAGLSSVKIAAEIRKVYNGWEAGTEVYRSMRIARTEVHQAAGTAMHESARQSGVAKFKAWLDAGDDRVRDEHVTNTAQGYIPFDDAFPDGAMFAGDGTNDIQCRCVMMYTDRQG